MPVQELPEISVQSKSPGNTPEKIAEVLNGLGYNVTASEQVTDQPTPDEIAEAERKEQETADAAKAVEETATAEKEEKERTTRNERRRLAKEADKKAIADATTRAEAAERRANELATAQEKLQRDIEDMRKNPPKAEPEPAAPVEPKRPQRVDFVDKEDPEGAYEDALLEYGDLRREYKAQLAEHNKPKTEPKKEEPVAAPATQQATYSDDELKAIDVAKISQPPLKRFMESVKTVTAGHPGAYKAIVDNVPNVNDAIIQSGHTFDEPARIQLYLARHPEESKRIKVLTDGNVQENPRLLRIAQKELEKIEQLAAEEDAALPKSGSETDEEQPEADPETDAAAARHTPQPQMPAAAAPQPRPAAKQQKKHEPISPVGAHGAQVDKRYEDMTEAEQRALSIDEVRKLRGQL